MTASPDALEVLRKAVESQKYRVDAVGYQCLHCCGRTERNWYDLVHRKSCWVGQAERLLKGEEK